MLVDIRNISKSFGDKSVLDDISFTIEDTDRIGLVGINGCGKSTLLNLICKKLDFEKAENVQGGIFYKSGLRIGFLEQNSGLERDNTLFAEMQTVFASQLQAQAQMHQMEAKMAAIQDHTLPEYLCLSQRYATLLEQFEQADGYQIEVQIKKVLNGMGFGDKDYGMHIRALSGGEKTRLALAKLLLENPDLLILDEPTNHLDFQTLMWLETYLQTYKGALLIVSHDRYFLDRVVTKIWEIERTKGLCYPGNYSKYKLLRQARIEHQMKEYEKQQKQIASMETFIEKNIVRATSANAAKSKRARLAQLDLIEKPIDDTKTAKLRFDYAREPVKDVLTVQDLTLEVGVDATAHVLSRHINLQVRRGDKIALIGPNGVGKSTFLKAILGYAPQKNGSVHWGNYVKTAFFEQENLTLDFEKTALEELWSRHPNQTEASIRTNLGRVLLSGENVYKKVGVLSGGERAKLAFAVMLMEHGNTLVLDEPTNHLDLATKEVLEEALVAFDGTLLFVSHDRYFLNRIPNKIAVLNHDGITLYDGNFDAYLEQSCTQPQLQPIQQKPKQATREKKVSSSYRTKQQRAADVKRKAQITRLEQLIAQCESDIDTLNTQLSTPEVSADYLKAQALYTELEQTKAALDEHMQAWLTLSEELE